MAGEGTISELGEQIHRMAHDTASMDTSAQHLQVSFGRMVGALGQFKLAEHLVDIIKRTEIVRRLSFAVSAEGVNRNRLLEREIDLDDRIAGLRQTDLIMSEKQKAQRAAEVIELTKELDMIQRQKVFLSELETIGRTRLGLMGAAFTVGSDLFFKERQLNQNLIEANSSYGHRAELLHRTLRTQNELGISFEKVTESARALVHWNMDAEDTFAQNVKLVAQMEQGLGVSVEESARLATIVERQLKGSFQGVADVVAELVNNTALAGNEVTRLGQSIATAMGRLRPGMSAAGLPDVLRLVGRYEGALKEIGGAPGALQQLVESLTKPEGIVGAGALGISPEFIATSKGVEEVMDRFALFGQRLVGESQGWERQFRLAQLGEIFNLSADQANQLMLAIRRARDAQSEQISLQERWRQQLHATNAGLIRLGNSIMALLNGAMYPFVAAVGYVANKLADGLEWLMENVPGLAYLISGTLALGVVFLTRSAFNLARQAFLTAIGVNTLTGAVARLGGVAGMSSAYNVGFLVGNVVRWSITPFARVLGLALTPLGIGLLGVGIAGLTIWASKQYAEIRALREQSAKLEQINLGRQRELLMRRDERIYQEARHLGSAAKIVEIYTKKARDLKMEATSPEDYRAKLAKAAQETLESVDQAVTTAVMFTPLKQRTPEQAQAEDELLGIQGKLLKVNEQTAAEFKTQNKTAAETKQELELEAAKHRFFLLRGQYNPLGIASDFYSDMFSH